MYDAVEVLKVDPRFEEGGSKFHQKGNTQYSEGQSDVPLTAAVRIWKSKPNPYSAIFTENVTLKHILTLYL